VQALYDRAGEPKSLRWTETEHVGARKQAIVADLVRLIEHELGDPAVHPDVPSMPPALALPSPPPPTATATPRPG